MSFRFRIQTQITAITLSHCIPETTEKKKKKHQRVILAKRPYLSSEKKKFNTEGGGKNATDALQSLMKCGADVQILT